MTDSFLRVNDMKLQVRLPSLYAHVVDYGQYEITAKVTSHAKELFWLGMSQNPVEVEMYIADLDFYIKGDFSFTGHDMYAEGDEHVIDVELTSIGLFLTTDKPET